MSVSSYLKRIADNAIIRDTEKDSIRTSISTIETRLDAYFGSDVQKKFIFGSYTRGTILPRVMDERSDIDYMVVFKDDDSKPQTYLNRLRRFVEKYYSNSETKQSHPTIKLELNHITFELVPALSSWWSGYKIPSRESGVDDWMDTDPNDFNQTLTDKNKEYNYIIKPLIRLMKYWNAENGYVYESYGLEKWVVGRSFSGDTIFHMPDLRQCLYQCFEGLGTSGLTQTSKAKLERAKKIVADTQEIERKGYDALAEVEIAKLIPDPATSTKGLAASILRSMR